MAQYWVAGEGEGVARKGMWLVIPPLPDHSIDPLLCSFLAPMSPLQFALDLDFVTIQSRHFPSSLNRRCALAKVLLILVLYYR